MGDKGIVRRAIGEGVILVTEAIKTPPATYKYSVESTGFHKLTFTFNFEGSVNFGIVDCPFVVAGKPLQATVIANPFEPSPVVICRQLDVHKGGSLSMSMSWLIEQPDAPIVEKYLAQKEAEVQAKLARTRQLFTPRTIEVSSGEQINKLCDQARTNFIDSAFPPLAASLYTVAVPVAGSAVTNAEVVKPSGDCIVWRRPSEFFGEGTRVQVYEGNIEPNDIKQGQLGDCWLMCSLASIAEFPDLVRQLFVSHDYNERGVYQIRLCKGGLWINVTVDDFFPCKPEGGPIYSRANGNELWVLLLEKAFAKVHGSYAAIKSGWAFEAMMDLTGAPYKDIRFNSKEVAEKIADGSLWRYIVECDEREFILSCSTGGVDKMTENTNRGGTATGLVPGHAYTLLTARATSTGDRLVKLRNPWGSLEWSGAWSDSCPRWTPELKAEMGFVGGDDGTFWMSFEDLVKHFTGVNVCMCRNPARTAAWKESRHPIEYTFSKSGRGVVNVNMFSVTVKHTCDLYASVHQKDRRIIGSLPYMDVGVCILQADSSGKFRHVASSGTAVERQNQFEARGLAPGEYLVIPVSTGCKFQSTLNGLGRQATNADYHRQCAIAFHSERDFTVREVPFNAEAFEEAMELPVIEAGAEMDLFGDRSVLLYTRKSGYSGISYVAKNTTDSDAISLTLDLTGSANIVSHRGGLQAEVMVPPREAKVMHHIFPEDDHKDWSAGWSCNARWLTEEEAHAISVADIKLNVE